MLRDPVLMLDGLQVSMDLAVIRLLLHHAGLAFYRLFHIWEARGQYIFFNITFISVQNIDILLCQSCCLSGFKINLLLYGTKVCQVFIIF